jgi:hypothetical protein
MSQRKMKALPLDSNGQSHTDRERMSPDLTAQSMPQEVDTARRMIHVHRAARHDRYRRPNRWGGYVLARRVFGEIHLGR